MFLRLSKFLGATAMILTVTWLLLFVAINFMLGCESWDEQYWTEYNSCIYPSQMLGLD